MIGRGLSLLKSEALAPWIKEYMQYVTLYTSASVYSQSSNNHYCVIAVTTAAATIIFLLLLIIITIIAITIIIIIIITIKFRMLSSTAFSSLVPR